VTTIEAILYTAKPPITSGVNLATSNALFLSTYASSYECVPITSGVNLATSNAAHPLGNQKVFLEMVVYMTLKLL
jgi:hypothetical protein